MKRKNFIILFVLILALIVPTGCSLIREKEVEKPEQNPLATMKIKDWGTVEIELIPEEAPNTVASFIELANSGFYDGLTFHRIIEGFMIQGGDPSGDGTGGPGYHIKGEMPNNNFDNKLLHEKGVISMARSPISYDSAGSQFFITVDDQPGLDGEYAVFGKVVDGMDVVMAISKVSTDRNDRPLDEVVIKSIKVDTFGFEYPKAKKIK
jgi:peptidyl-prolyl cis-trans isomerase B (cyclophilin B)